MRLIDADALRRKFEDAETQLCLKGEFGVAVGINVCFEALDEAETCSPQPDPETGLVRCGCGGKAKIWPSDPTQFTHVITDYEVGCTECAMTTGWVLGKQENAVKVWNTAMGLKGAGNDEGRRHD